MEILIIGSRNQGEEARLKFGDSHQYVLANSEQETGALIKNCQLVFDFTPGDKDWSPHLYQQPFSCTAFLETSKVALKQLDAFHFQGVMFGFCGMPTFLNRPLLEVSTAGEEHQGKLVSLCHELKTDYKIVADHIGLVTPRIICLLINEAFETVLDGTATREDIDLAMKLGTNYPYGPFEWCRRIGAENVCGLLKAVYKDTKDERYKPCRLLEKEAHAGGGNSPG